MSFFLYPPVQTVAAASPIKFVLDSVTVDVNEDTVTPANNKPLPVKLVDLSGNINITAGDLAVQLDHIDPVNFDSTRIGNGTNLLDINASNEALVHDTEALAELVLIHNKLPATLGSAADALSLTVTQSTEDKAALAAMSAKLPSVIGSNLDADSISVTQSTEDKAIMAALSAKLPSVIGSNLDADSLSVTQSTEDKVIQAAIQTAVEAIQTQAESSNDIVEDYFRQDFSSVNLLVATGFIPIRVLTSSIKKMNITNNSGNELVLQNATTTKEMIVGQGAVMDISMLGVATDVIEMKVIGADAVDGIIYINFEG